MQHTIVENQNIGLARFFTPDEAGLILGVSPITVRYYVRTGKLKVLSGFGRIRIPESELSKFLTEKTDYKARTRKRKPKGVAA